MKVIGYGDSVVDRYVNKNKVFPGGNCLNFAIYSSKLGAEAAYLGAFGGDAEAEIIQRAFHKFSVDISRCSIEQDRVTERCDVAIDEKGNRVFLYDDERETIHGPHLLTPEDLEYLKGFDLIHSSCYSESEDEMAKLKDMPGLCAYDFSDEEACRTDEYLERICPYIDFALFSCEGMKEEEIQVLLQKVHGMGVNYVLATMGPDGQCLFDGKQYYNGKAKHIEAVDTMGAGDSFFTAFLIGLLKRGWTKTQPPTADAIAEAFEDAANFAAQNCLVEGSFGCASPLKTMEYYIAETTEILLENIHKRKELLAPLFSAIEDASGEIMIVASGSSYYAALCALPYMKKQLGERIRIITPFTFLHYEDVHSDDTYFMVSQSGSSTNMIAALEKCRNYGKGTIAIVGKKASALGKMADAAIEYGVGEEVVGYVTKGMSTLVLFFMLFALEGGQYESERQYEEEVARLKAAASNHHCVYQYARAFCQENRTQLLEMKHVMFLGGGANLGTAQEGALKLSEMVHVQTNAFEAEEFLHGPSLQLTPAYHLFFIDGGDAAGKRIAEICTAAKEVTEAAYLISAKDLPIEKTDELISPLYLVAFFQYLAYFTAKALAITEEHPLFARFEEKIASKTEDYTEAAPF